MNNVVKRAWNQNRLVNIEDLCGMTFQAESGGHTFEISGVDDSGNNVSFSGTVEGRFLRPDNAQINISGSISNGKASVTLTSACYAIPGRFLLTIYVTSGNQKVAVYSATGSVVATSGLATGSIPPLETDSLIAGTVTANSITTNNITANGVVDITPRRAYASLSSAGWYRILKYSGDNQYAPLGTPSFIVRFGITRHASTASGEAHEITMTSVHNGSVKFSNEISNSNALIIDKIRYTYSGNNAYVDIHYNESGTNIVVVDFDVDARLYIKQEIVSQPFTSVGSSPAGETVLAEYSFASVTGMRVVHAQSSTSFGDAIATIKNIIGDDNITYGGNAANELNSTISGFSDGIVYVGSGGGPRFFVMLGKLNASYYAAELFSYNYPWRIRVRNVNGTYHAELYYPNY